MNVQPLFSLMVEKRASDLFLSPFAPVKIKIDGKIMPVNKLELTPKMIHQAAMEVMTEEQMEEFVRELEIDFAVSKPGLGRFRVNVFHQRGNVAMVMRYITADIPDLDKLGIAKTAREEKTRERDKKAKDAEMMKMYREHVLGEKPQPNIVPLTAIAPVVKPAAQEEVGSFGD